MPKSTRSLVVVGVALIVCSSARADEPGPFATRVMLYCPAPGQFVNNPTFNDPTRALGAPVGEGPAAASNAKVVTLGGFGGTITLGFDTPIVNLPPSVTNPRGCDLIVYGNAFYAGGVPSRRFAEAATIEVSRDDNANGLADDAWFLIRGSHTPPTPVLSAQTWDADPADPTYPPLLASWIPAGCTGMWLTSAYALPLAVFAGPVVLNPLGAESEVEGIWGYGDCTPTMILGDLDGDGLLGGDEDDPSIPPERFYCWPDDPWVVGVTKMSGGGDAIDLDWAVTPLGVPVSLDRVDFVRITTAVARISPLLGEASAEVSGVAVVRPRLLADVASIGGSRPPDGQLTVDDVISFFNAFAEGDPLADVVSIGGELPPDGELTVDDVIAFVNAFSDGR